MGAYLREYIETYIRDSVNTKNRLLTSFDVISAIENSVTLIIDTFKNGGKILVAGNGGSAADAQHIATELVSKFMYDRKPLNAIALTTNTSILTALGNDYGHEYIFSRQIQAYGKSGDIFIAISTSGMSKNIILAIEEAKKLNLKVIGLTGENNSEMDKTCDCLIKVPSTKTPIIQEAHIMIGHIICALTEKALT